MLSRTARVLLVGTSFAPVLLTLAFVDLRRGLPLSYSVGYLVGGALLIGLCLLVLYESSRRLEVMAISIESVKAADKEVVGFVLAYLLPLVNTFNVSRMDPAVLWFVIAILFVVTLTSNSYHFNPVLGIAGYHFYEVTTRNKVGFILVTKRTITDVGTIGPVVQLTDYMLLEKER